jgi:hypothetical protein
MLDFLVTSPARRRLLLALWQEGASGSTAHLAEYAGVAFASAHRELRAMKKHGLVESERPGAAELFRANFDHPLARALKELLAARPRRFAPVSRDAEAVRARLMALGAPLLGSSAPSPPSDVETALVDGVKLAHRDPAVARSLPVCLWKLRGSLDRDRLVRLARRAGEKRALGFFLELTSQLAGDTRFVDWVKPLRDHRVTTVVDFFDTPGSRGWDSLSELNTPEAARRWGYRMNLDETSFRSLFAKFTHVI